MRFTLGTLVGIVLGVVAAPIAARTPGLGPAVTDAQAQAWRILRTHTMVPSASTGIGPADRREQTTPRDRSSQPPRRGGIVKIATIAAIQAGAVDAPLARTPVQTVDDDADAAIAFAGDVSVHDAATSHAAAADADADAAPHIDTETGANGDLDRRIGVLDRLFATYDRVDEE
ncbi:MAG: hypothetical protein E4H03_12190 [Myxococcales bacterium]|nr:MAG: hypothetical protein E4H03_12190 [Myxococcales bacterium]